jgi:asparagine synthase (glutamine-hydrolysing)
MCGIAGFYRTDAPSGADSILRRMCDEIQHRGPDGFGYHCEAPVWLGHRRLSIIDLSTGSQPMSNETGRIWIVYNGEIFNHGDLRPTLEKAGHVYKSHCDTETILHAYEQFGPECLKYFTGFFAFVLWDADRKTLFCARDRMGIKPFYYYWDGKLFAFASEIKALLQHPEISAQVEESSIPETLTFGYASGEKTMFANIRKLMPGHHLTLRTDVERPAPDIRQYWDVPAFEPDPRSEQELIAECRSRIEESVRLRLMSDVPLGMFLSGGLDSSLIAALMKRMVSGPVMTFAVGYAETAYSELGYARHVAEHLGTSHHEVLVSMDDFFGALPQMIWHEDEPITFSSSVPLYFVSKLAAEHVKVVLTGEGSDELFAGYERYRYHLINERMMGVYRYFPKALQTSIRGFIGSSDLLSATFRRKLLHTVLGKGDRLEELYLDNFYCAFEQKDYARLVSHNGLGNASPYSNFMGHWDSRPQSSTLARMLYSDQKTYLVELLMKQDQMSMAASIESRVPFLDHNFVEFAARVPDSLKLHGNTAKYILKKAVADLLPPEIIYRTKMGFPTPVRRWFREPAARPLLDRLRDPNGFLAAYIDRHVLDSLLERHISGAVDATDRIWRLLNLQIWGDLFITGRKFDPASLLGCPPAKA